MSQPSSNKTAKQYPALKDHFDRDLVEKTARRFRKAYSAFDCESFERYVLNGFEPLSLTQRSERIAEALREHLPEDYPDAIEVVLSALPEELESADNLMESGFDLWPFGDFIKLFGDEYPEASLEACYRLTKCFTAEFAIRPLIAKHPDDVRQYLKKWVTDPNEHVRRLVSEGTRPRLPWASKLVLSTEYVLPLLEQLKADESEYVRRSVANHLNDLAKDHSDLVVDLLTEWHATDIAETQWIVRHAMRNHLKNGDKRVLKLFGFLKPKIKAGTVTVDPEIIEIGDKTKMSFEIGSESKQPQKLMVDFVVHFVKSNGRTAEKVFKLKTVELEPKDTILFEKTVDFSPRNTRRIYPGKHQIEIQVNGERVGSGCVTVNSGTSN